MYYDVAFDRSKVVSAKLRTGMMSIIDIQHGDGLVTTIDRGDKDATPLLWAILDTNPSGAGKVTRLTWMSNVERIEAADTPFDIETPLWLDRRPEPYVYALTRKAIDDIWTGHYVPAKNQQFAARFCNKSDILLATVGMSRMEPSEFRLFNKDGRFL